MRQRMAVLEESEARFRTLFDNAGDAIFIHNTEGRFLEVNRVACERLGYSREELLRMGPMNIDAPEFALFVPWRIEELQQHGHVFFETAHVKRDGTVIPIELSSRVIQYEGKSAILSIARDITERKRSEEALRTSEEKFRSIYAESPIGIEIYDSDGLLIDTNRACLDIFGVSDVAEVKGFNLFDDPNVSEA
jgi:PAS domain S-box-containing protein